MPMKMWASVWASPLTEKDFTIVTQIVTHSNTLGFTYLSKRASLVVRDRELSLKPSPLFYTHLDFALGLLNRM